MYQHHCYRVLRHDFKSAKTSPCCMRRANIITFCAKNPKSLEILITGDLPRRLGARGLPAYIVILALGHSARVFTNISLGILSPNYVFLCFPAFHDKFPPSGSPHFTIRILTRAGFCAITLVNGGDRSCRTRRLQPPGISPKLHKSAVKSRQATIPRDGTFLLLVRSYYIAGEIAQNPATRCHD